MRAYSGMRYKSLIPTFGRPIHSEAIGIKLLKLSHARMFSHSKILFLVPLLFVTSIPTYFLNF